MGVTALVMAGGKGTRMALHEEKPLLKVGGRPMIEHVLGALKNAKKVDEIVVAVSKHTPKTARLVKRLSVRVLKTPGGGYVSDVEYAVRKLKLNTVFTISADLPLITGEVIDEIIERYERCGKPALTVVVRMETKERFGLEGGYVLKVGNNRLVPAGMNVIDGRKIDGRELEEEIYVIDREEVAVNVNTLRELGVAERLFMERLRGRDQRF